ncbi:MAG TPA: hypothetical protein VEW48_22890 [Thermoanaerobaculia bacterium]|nr:hypothetical protein [Thermoanaerobaculia bacterium]
MPPRKGMGPLGWIAIGCGAIALLGVLTLAVGGYMFKKKVVDPFKKNPTLTAAEYIVRANPELEVVSSDQEKGTLTIKNKKTGETVTMNASDIEHGKISFKTDKGTTVVDTSQAGESGGVKVTGADGSQLTFGGEAPKNLPSWVPVYPGSTVTGAMDTTNSEGRTATFAISSDDAVDKVIEFYEAKLGEAGLKVSKTTMDAGGQHSAIITATSEDDKRNANVTVGQQEGKTQATVSFVDKK